MQESYYDNADKKPRFIIHEAACIVFSFLFIHTFEQISVITSFTFLLEHVEDKLKYLSNSQFEKKNILEQKIKKVRRNN